MSSLHSSPPSSLRSSTDSLSPSPPTGPPTLQQLVDHFVAAKRALATTAQVVRANEIVTEARAALEENAILNAKNGFARTCVREQVRSLEAVRVGIGKVGDEGEEEFQVRAVIVSESFLRYIASSCKASYISDLCMKTVLRALDTADARLKSTLNTLRSTLTHPSLNPSAPPQALYTFVDERAIADVTAALHSSIDAYKAASDSLADSISSLDGILASLKSCLTAVPSSLERDTVTALPAHLRDLEDHATEMADLLQALVRHYDLCVSALKHTEGGGEAVAQATEGDADAAADVPVANPAADGAPPMSDEERAEMLAVLDKDAAEVEDVVTEIKERGAEMEAVVESVAAHRAQVREEHAGLLSILRQLSKAAKDIRVYVSAAVDFLGQWESEKGKIRDNLEELEGLRDFYEGFLGAYDGLIVEIGRRRNVQSRMRRILQDAMTKIDKLYQGKQCAIFRKSTLTHDRKEDVDEREAFKADQGEYLPSDIWPGLTEPPAKYEITPLEPDAVDIPDIPKDVLEMAIHRVRLRLQGR